MPARETSSAWHIGASAALDAAHVAPRLAALSIDAALRYRGVHLEASIDDVTARCDARENHYRVFLLEAVHWPALELPHRRRLPERWRSEVVSMPRHRPGDPWARLTDFEAEFVARGLLRQIEWDIDRVFEEARREGEIPAGAPTGSAQSRVG